MGVRIVSGNAFSPIRCQVITDLSWFGPLGTNVSELRIKMLYYFLTKMNFKKPPPKFRLLCECLNVMWWPAFSSASYQYILETETILKKYSSLTVSEIVKVSTSVEVLYSFTDHYNDVIMGTIASQITSLTLVYSTVYSEDADQRKYQSSAPLAFVRGIRDRWIPRTNGQ